MAQINKVFSWFKEKRKKSPTNLNKLTPTDDNPKKASVTKTGVKNHFPSDQTIFKNKPDMSLLGVHPNSAQSSRRSSADDGLGDQPTTSNLFIPPKFEFSPDSDIKLSECDKLDPHKQNIMERMASGQPSAPSVNSKLVRNGKSGSTRPRDKTCFRRVNEIYWMPNKSTSHFAPDKIEEDVSEGKSRNIFGSSDGSIALTDKTPNIFRITKDICLTFEDGRPKVEKAGGDMAIVVTKPDQLQIPSSPPSLSKNISHSSVDLTALVGSTEAGRRNSAKIVPQHSIKRNSITCENPIFAAVSFPQPTSNANGMAESYHVFLENPSSLNLKKRNVGSLEMSSKSTSMLPSISVPATPKSKTQSFFQKMKEKTYFVGGKIKDSSMKRSESLNVAEKKLQSPFQSQEDIYTTPREDNFISGGPVSIMNNNVSSFSKKRSEGDRATENISNADVNELSASTKKCVTIISDKDGEEKNEESLAELKDKRAMEQFEKRRQSLAQRRLSNLQLVQSLSGRRISSTTLLPLSLPQIHLIRSLWRQVYISRGPTQLGQSLFHKFFFSNALNRDQFKHCNLPEGFPNHDSFSKAHCKATGDMIDKVVMNLDNLENVTADLERVGRVHAELCRGELSSKIWNTVAECFIDATLEWGDKRSRTETVRKAWALIIAFIVEKIKSGHLERRKMLLSYKMLSQNQGSITRSIEEASSNMLTTFAKTSD
uniref:GLOBIN domain-containing protein n=1 Tax=Rhabditophanes sp. KR3021 TaxID=114890 RepID=A0AC35U4D4_9BILA